MGLFTKSTPAAIPAIPPAAAPQSPAPAAVPTAPGLKPGGMPPPAAVPVVAAPSIAPPARLAPMVVSSQQSERQVYFQQLKVRIHQRLVERLDMQNIRTLPPDVVRAEVRLLVKELCQSEK